MATGNGAQRATIADRGGPNVNPGQIKVNKKVRFDFIFKSYETGVSVDNLPNFGIAVLNIL